MTSTLDSRAGMGPQVYYALLDSVRFDPEKVESADLAINAGSALSALLVDLAVLHATPGLTQNQVFDNRLLLDLVRQGDSDSDAFQRLLRAGSMRVFISERRLDPVPPESERFTLLNAFASQLDSPFIYSAWPELSDHALRAEVKAYLGGATDSDPGGELSTRLDALLAMDDALRSNPASLHGARPDRGELGRIVEEDVAALSRQSEPMNEFWTGFSAWIGRNKQQGSSAAASFDFRFRSDWRHALAAFALEHDHTDENAQQSARVSTVVDIHYNRLQASSTLSIGVQDETSDLEFARILDYSSANPSFRERAIYLIESGPSKVLSWTEVEARREVDRVLTPKERLDLLVEDQQLEILEDALITQTRFPASRLTKTNALTVERNKFEAERSSSGSDRLWVPAASISDIETRAVESTIAPGLDGADE